MKARPTPPAPSLLEALSQLTAEVGMPLDELLRTVEVALAEAYRRAFQPDGEIAVRIDPVTAALVVEQRRTVEGVETVEVLPSDDFRRLAAQTAKQAVMRHLRDLERERVLKEVTEHRGELAGGIIDRVEGGTCFIDLGRAEGVMPAEEQIPGEELRPGRPLTVLLLETVRRHGPVAQVRVSRAARAFVQRLLEAEVPEVANGTVKVMGMAREPGLRTKIAVAAEEPGIDPVGACVGPKGVRHRSLLSELGHEHLDIVPWFEAPERLVAAALGPAEVVSVTADAATRTATVHVPRTQLSLAIGKDGQNARLAARLTGWRIDIKAAPEAG